MLEECVAEVFHMLLKCWSLLESVVEGFHTSHAFTRAARRSRLSETESKWFLFETSRYVFGGQIRR